METDAFFLNLLETKTDFRYKSPVIAIIIGMTRAVIRIAYHKTRATATTLAIKSRAPSSVWPATAARSATYQT